MLLRYTHQINQRKTTPIYPSPIDRSLYLLTHITLYDKLTKLGIPIIKTIKNLTNITKRTNNETSSHVRYIFYPMQRLQQTLHRRNPTQSRKKKKRIHEHKRSLKTNDRNTLFSHMLEFQTHSQIFPSHQNQTHTLQKFPKLQEYAVISQNKQYKTASKFYQISPYLGNIILNENKIKIENEWEEKKIFQSVPPDF